MIWLKWAVGFLLWKKQIIYDDGSVQKIAETPDDLEAIYKYVFQPDAIIFYKTQLLMEHLKVYVQLLPLSMNKYTSKVVLKSNFLNFNRISRKICQDLWHQISIIGYTIKYIFIMCTFYVIDFVTLYYKFSRT
jgi:hypothetical protein